MSATPHILPPAHGGQLREIAARFGISTERLTDFSANINPAGPPASVLAAIRSSLEDSNTLAVYPDLELVELKQTIARYAGVHPENVSVANGFVPLLEAALLSFKIKRCLLPVPSFSEYRRVLENAGIAVVPHPLSQDDDFRYKPDAIRTALLEHSCDAILLANPQNPSGASCDAEIMRSLIAMASQHNVMVLLDEAFIDYCPTQSVTTWSIEQPNVIVFRSVTKFFAIPGLRVAYAASASSNVRAINGFIAPWPITSFASDAVCAALTDQTYAEDSRLTNDRSRSRLEEQLAAIPIRTCPSSTNFLLLQFPATVDVRLLWERMVREEQIVLRSCINFEGLAGGHLRTAVRSETGNERLVRSLKRVLSSFGR